MKLLVGDVVRVIVSPYRAVSVGSVAIVRQIIRKHFCEPRKPDYDVYALYKLSGLPYENFRRHELEKVEVEK